MLYVDDHTGGSHAINDGNVRAGSATLDICLHLTYVVGPQGGSPSNADQYVEFMWEGAFSAFSFHGKFIQTLLKPVPANAKNCDSTPWVQTPNVVVVDLERV